MLLLSGPRVGVVPQCGMAMKEGGSRPRVCFSGRTDRTCRRGEGVWQGDEGRVKKVSPCCPLPPPPTLCQSQCLPGTGWEGSRDQRKERSAQCCVHWKLKVCGKLEDEFSIIRLGESEKASWRKGYLSGDPEDEEAFSTRQGRK